MAEEDNGRLAHHSGSGSLSVFLQPVSAVPARREPRSIQVESRSAIWSVFACRRCSWLTQRATFKDEGLDVELDFMPIQETRLPH